MAFVANITVAMGAFALLGQAAAAETTGPAGGGAPVGLYQPSLAVTQLVATDGFYPPRDGSPSDFYLGQVRSFAGNFEAFGAERADGQLQSIANNTALFSLLGTQYGGDGFSTFALPDLAGRTIIGAAAGLGNVGERTGAETSALTVLNLPAHSHRLTPTLDTDPAGSGVAFDKRQPGLALVQMIAVDGIFPLPTVTTGVTFIGQMGSFAGNFAPSGWLPADGRLLAIADYQNLFQLIGTTFGGNGVDNFALPDLVGRTAVGTGTGPGLAPVSLGQSFGSDTVQLTLATMPVHTHSWPQGTTDPAGGNAGYNNYQASLGINHLIALNGIFPSRDGGGFLPPGDTPMLGEIVGFAGNFAPQGWAFANGQLLGIAQNQALFSLLGTNFGGDGRVNFALPDLRGRTMIGTGSGFEVGDRFGTATTFLSVAQLPVHVHGLSELAVVPEPASWAMLITGFGLVGTAVRRRRAAVA